jgi:hypothetical protein
MPELLRVRIRWVKEDKVKKTELNSSSKDIEDI